MGHIELSRAADLVVVAPATADLMGKLAAGLANDLASTALLATDKKILMAPAMNVRMWQSPPCARNFATLKKDGVLFVGPNDGEMACGEFGPGRMAEPLEIVAAIEQALGADGPAGRHARAGDGGPDARAGGSGALSRQPFLAASRAMPSPTRWRGRARETMLISGPVVARRRRAGVKLMRVTTAREMLAACEAALPADVLVMAAAVADWRPDIAANSKIKKSTDRVVPLIKLVENPDILATLAAQRRSGRGW